MVSKKRRQSVVNSATNLQQAAQPQVDKPPELLEHDYTYYLSTQQNENNQNTVKDQFAKLKYGNNRELIFNLNCQIKYLIDYFYTKLNQSAHVESLYKENLDLTDLDGNLKNLKQDHSRLASDVLNARELYILVDSKQCDQNGIIYESMPASTDKNLYFRITPLLINNSDLITQSYMNTINARAFKQGKNKYSSLNSSSNSQLNKTNKQQQQQQIQQQYLNLTLIKEFDETTDVKQQASTKTKKY